MYEAIADPYCYPGSDVLRNRPGLIDQGRLDEFEAAATTQRADEPLPGGRRSVSHYRAIHRHLFQDVYGWAGRFRTVRLSKSGSAFCYPEYIGREMRELFAALHSSDFLRSRSPEAFADGASEFLATLNAIHPFREGNGRAQTLFLALLGDQAGHPLDLERLEPEPFLAAMIRSFSGDLAPLRDQIRLLIS
ncbi:MAG TPA: Fic family protein [Caulobacteraceae bacterium]